ncbi:PstS family phosphate ABC transporter substrate-binding protein [Nocardioides antri]|uniref:Phosphate-binding protein n=1 Tax=Nocardioides antri TaxID=2607659 RepID=A0A5B1M435_9ACTN|nr:PstS family phosphate ABC transporter substrate-binding protein [Nocardioides antri]KAA1427511.1 PstS family phosphate ABC transporter substrate-binding protein [Nocardioides antri]
MNVTPLRRALVPGVAALALFLTACGGDSSAEEDGSGAGAGDLDTSVTGEVAVDGSSTVYPMTTAAQELMTLDGSPIQVSVGQSGTGGGFEVFCAGETDISNASRPIKDDEEVPVCEENGVEYTELQVAVDALTVVVHPDLAVDCLTVDELIALFGPKSKAENWQDINPEFPDQEITGFIPGADSGTYDYMAADVVADESETLRNDFESSEDDNVLVNGVSGTPGAVGFFGYTYFEENADKLKALEIDSGDGCVAPSAETAQDGSYTPLARPLFIYVSNKSYTEKPAVAEFVDYYVANLETVATGAGFIALNETDYAATKDALAGIGG